MKKVIVAVIVFIGVIVAWSAWPFIGLHAIANAARSGDLADLTQRVDLPALRRSVATQFAETYLRVAGVKLPPALAAGLASLTADPVLEELLTARALATLLRGEWPGTVVAVNDVPHLPQVDWDSARQILRLYWASHYGLGSFRLALPPEVPLDERFDLELELSGTTWKLAGLRLPQQFEERLVRAVLKARGALN